MSNINDSPYTGNWTFNQTQVIKYTPDALVYINGDLSIPGCNSCNGRIDIQKYITSISVDASTDPTGHSANITLSLPKVQGEQVFIDGKNILRPGLEVHIFMRGAFPIAGQFNQVENPQISDDGSESFDLTNYASYPYYPVFHGVVTQSNYEYGDGFYSGSLACSGMLHFWNYQNITSNQAFLGTRPNNTPGKTSLVGHNFNNMHPYAIIYTLYKDTTGAAMAVEYALDEQTNLDAVGANGQQIYDQISLYWEQRFKTRVMSLRMYGVNGQMFNAAQQAFLASASNRDLEGLMSNNLYSDPETQRSESDPFSSRLSVAKALGLANGGLDLTYSPYINSEGDSLNLSILDMYAFNQEQSEIGTVPLFETTYQTKMDVAQAVTEVTGFELYQDVDGDIVFKPPFYNLDTSTNRFYRIEDIDILDISFVEKEPEATFISVRGSWFKGLSGVVPNTGVTGKRGLYIDYKLVAQFGWRPANLEVNYATDPRILFFIGVARLDQLNIDVNSASVTIAPGRPELRPGYPVYIPFVDSYYYVTSVSHSFAFGGRFTSTLTLTCRRSKFLPPAETGDPGPGQSMIDLVKLDRPDLPRRTIQVYDKQGIPRIVGFPNVVLALDPTKANPHFFPVGAGLDYINSTDDVRAFFQFLREDIAAQTPQILRVSPEFADVDGRVKASVPTEEVTYQLDLDANNSVTFSLTDLERGFTDLQAVRDNIRSLEEQIRSLEDQEKTGIQDENIFTSGGRQAKVAGPSSNRRQIELESQSLSAQLQNESAKLQGLIGDEGSANQNKLVLVLNALQQNRGSPSRRKINGLPASDVKATYFDSLLNLKSQFGVSDLPGRFRYFSSAHPNPDYQGQPIILFDDGEVQPPTGNPQLAQGSPVGGSGVGGPLGGLANAVEDSLTAATTPAKPPTTSGGLPTDPRRRLQAKIDALSVEWVGANQLSASTLIARGEIPPGSSKGSAGAFSYGGKAENLTEEVSNNIANVIDAANKIRSRLLSNSEFASLGFSIGAGSFWRDKPEDEASESLHKLGKAIDLGLRPTQSDAIKAGKLTEFKRAFDIFKAECLKAFGNREVNFVQVYENRGSGKGDFIHIDIRSPEDGSPGFAFRGVSPTGDPYVVNGNPSRSAAKAERERLAQIGGFNYTDLFTDEGGVGRKKSKGPKRPFPASSTDGGDTIPATTENTSTSPSVEQSPQPRREPNITFRDVVLDPPRKVVQFLKDPKKPDPRLRSPEAELGLGTCTRGFNIAQGPGRPAQILTTDQIQTLLFAQFNSEKFVNVLGVSQTTGEFNVNNGALFAKISATFNNAIPELENGNQTPIEVFGDLYNQLKKDIEAVKVPTYTNGVKNFPDVSIQVPTFEFAVKSVAIPEGSPLAVQLNTPNIEVATTPFDILAAIPGYSSDSSSSVESNVGVTVEKVANAYAQSLANTITNAFNAARDSASEPQEGKNVRLAEINFAFNNIVAAVTGVQTNPGTILWNALQLPTPESAKASKNKHSPVFPVSDEKGYEHYGAYRYGRGLTVDPGGTWEFLHSNGDPFSNADAKTTEEFLRVLTLVKQQGYLSDQAQAVLSGIRDSETAAFLNSLSENTTGLSLGLPGEEQAPPLGAEPPENIRRREEAAIEALKDINLVVAELNRTPQGQETLRSLLEFNGDNPDLITQDTFDISQTQFARRFGNFAATYAQSPVFKTTISNAAYRLADLTSHILERTGAACRCRGNYADLVLSAYGREDFVALDTIDQESDPTSAFVSEQVLGKETGYSIQQQQVQGSIVNTDPNANTFDAKFSGDATKTLPGVIDLDGDNL